MTDKLSTHHFTRQEEIRPLFESQLAACGVEYFDFYLMHAQDRNIFEKFKKCRAYEMALEFLAEGKIKHFGISFHDRAEVLERILTEYPQIEVVQIQFNYLDYEDEAVESRKVYEVCEKHGKPVIVMEPVKGGGLVNLPEEAQQILDALHGGSNASYAIRFAASFPNIMMVLSGMGNLQMMRENTGFMQDFKPLTDAERKVIREVQRVLSGDKSIPCTACHYCTDNCPMNIPIPEIFAVKNKKDSTEKDYIAATEGRGKASDCIACGQCENACPQQLSVIQYLRNCAEKFENGGK